MYFIRSLFIVLIFLNQHPVVSQNTISSRPDLSRASSVNDQQFLLAKFDSRTSILEVRLHNRSATTLQFVRSGLEGVALNLRDRDGNAVDERKFKQVPKTDTIKVRERSWQLISIAPGEEILVARVDLRTRFEFSNGKYTLFATQRVYKEGTNEDIFLTSEKIVIKMNP